MPEILRLYPPPAREVGEIYRNVSFPVAERRDPSRPYVVINMVGSLDGRAAVVGRAGGIGGPPDRRAMRVLRSKADAVMVGAGTLRAEKLSLSSESDREPLAVVVAGRGDLPLEENLVRTRRDRTLVIVPEGMSEGRRRSLAGRARVLRAPTVGPGRIDLGRALGLLGEEYGVKVLLAEGGPSLNHAMISSGLAHELFLTLSPKLLGGAHDTSPSILEGGLLEPQRRARLLSIHLAGDDLLFLRYGI